MPYQQQKIQLLNGQQINYIQINPHAQTHILFVHGNFSSWTWWKDVLDIIKSNLNYHIIAIDQRGFGKSSYKQPVLTFQSHAQDLIQFIKLKNLKNVVLVGWSYGGVISMKTAELAPDLISKIIPTASVNHLGLPFFNQKGQQIYTRQSIAQIPRIAFAQNIRKNKDYQAQKNIYELVLFQKMSNYPQQKKKQLIQSSFLQAQYLDVLIALANADIDIDKIKAKTLMLHGSQDIVIKLQSVQITAKFLNNSLQIWQNHGHMLPIEDVNRFVQRISKFIDQK